MKDISVASKSNDIETAASLTTAIGRTLTTIDNTKVENLSILNVTTTIVDSLINITSSSLQEKVLVIFSQQFLFVN